MTRPGFETVRVPKAAELVASALRMEIVTGALPENASLPAEAALMQQFGVSRPTLREAFRILESESLIDVRRGARGGARILVPDARVISRHVGYLLQFRSTNMKDVYAARTMLELPLGISVAESATDADVDRLQATLDSADESLDDSEMYVEHDIAFHLLVAELAGNETMHAMVEMLFGVVTKARRSYASSLAPDEIRAQQREVHKTHQYFLDDIRAGERSKARELWTRHLREVEHRYAESSLADSVVAMMG